MEDYSIINRYDSIKNIVVWYISLVFGCFHLYTAIFGVKEALYQRSIHLAFAGVLCFLIYNNNLKKYKFIAKILDVFLIVFSFIPVLYLIADYDKLSYRFFFVAPLEWYQYLFCGMLIITVLEGTRRTIGNALPIIAIISLIYFAFGQYFPGSLGHGGFSAIQIVDTLYQTTEGIYGIALGASATYVILFITFGAFLQQSGVGEYFIQLATTLTSKSIGGPAKSAVIASCLFGMISGSSTANVVTTGQITIPLMKKTGYSPVFAGAVEAVASTGGQIMPPVMGTAAFIMSEYTGIPYSKIIIYALLPGFLYYFSVFAMVHFRAVKLGLKPVERIITDEARKAENLTMIKKSYLLLPIVIMVAILIKGYSPTYAVLGSFVAIILVSYIEWKNRLKFKDILNCIVKGVQDSIAIAMVCACAGIVVGVINYTGIAIRISNTLILLSQNNLLITLIITAVTAIILGMGLPTTPAYIVVSTLLVPAIVKMGIPLISAHLFAFYFANVSAITPPVALSAYAAAAISKASPIKTGYSAFFLGIASYIVPIMFVYHQELLFIGDNYLNIAITAIFAILGISFISMSVEGYFKEYLSVWKRIVIFVAGLFCIYPEIITSVVSCMIVFLLIIPKKRVLQIFKK